jgi:hypothetical protein
MKTKSPPIPPPKESYFREFGIFLEYVTCFDTIVL